ncbi:PREDICTED: uncharacterized protein K02A2.6-like [Paramuricea clavata]|uniref:PREDICTED: uncharacterized protein K02A2.6-like n=1 Tax=Paramuricea clavata TaxID=317549 RepID=A0A6S7GI42_PARCT|nr:PREDICTED: uncharacterized protein K02A2.6-like [Paramuricea clavata]
MNKLDEIVRVPKEQNTGYRCSRSDGNHNPTKCRFKESNCHASGEIGHISRACRSKAKRKQPPKGKPKNHLSEQGQGSSSEDSPNEENASTSAFTPLGMAQSSMARIDINYASPFMGKMFLLIIDAHSKWLDVHYVNTATTETTITKLRVTFATHGIPQQARAMTNSELGVPLLDQPDLHDTVGQDVPLQEDMGGPVLEFENESVRRYPTGNQKPPDRFE